jgi:hypothetical protein
MNGALSRALREHVNAFLLGQISLPGFQDWLIAATWDIEEQADPQAVDWTYEIKLALAEHTRGDIGVVEFRQRLQQIVEPETRVARAGTVQV